MTIGERIKQRRKELNLSADALAQRLGKNRATVYRYERGDIESLPLDILKPLAEALQTSPGYLMGWEGMQKKNDAITDIIITMRTDENFFYLVEKLHKLNGKQREIVEQSLSALFAAFEK